MEEEYGIDQLKDICLTLVQLGIKLEEATAEDSAKGAKISLTEGVALLIFLIPKAISHAGSVDQIKAELADLSSEEIEELNAHIAEKLDLDNDKIEDLVEAVLDWVVATNDLRLAVKDILKKDE